MVRFGMCPILRMVDGEPVSDHRYFAVTPELARKLDRGEDPLDEEPLDEAVEADPLDEERQAATEAAARRRGRVVPVSPEDAERAVRAAEEEGTSQGLRDSGPDRCHVVVPAGSRGRPPRLDWACGRSGRIGDVPRRLPRRSHPERRDAPA